jgi:diguanylate cyclase (GGDEF)-like protein
MMRRALLRDLHNALSNEEFALEYQPLISLQDDSICSCEALLRWRHPLRGVVPPAEFIPVLESSGLIVPVGEWVVRQACSDAATWPDNVRVAVNVSVVQFNSPGFVKQITATLEKAGFPGRRLDLELTESVLLDDSKGALAELRELHGLGVKIVLDDFGTGYSSLSYLETFPFDAIKIDRCFIRRVSAHDPSSLTIFRSLTRLGSSLGIETTAEGIETEAQLGIVRTEGCTSAQGYFLYRPMPATEVRSVLWAQTVTSSQQKEGGTFESRWDSSEAERLQALEQYDIMDTPPEESFDRITRIARSIMNAPVAMISFVDRDRQWFKSKLGIDMGESSRESSFCTHTIQSDGPLVVPDTLRDPRFRDSPLVTGPAGVRSYIGVPLRTLAGHRIGALCVNDVNPRDVSQDQLGRLQDLAGLVVDELELRKLATIDGLTGTATARVFASQGKFAFNTARRHGRELSCIILDLDHFKQINDRYGHPAGDQVLEQVGRLSRSLIRSTDTLARIGGEEFGILLPETTTASAAAVAELVREEIDLLVVGYSHYRIRPTASCGVASLQPQDRSFASLLARADAALYEAKGAGRNRVATEGPRVGAKSKIIDEPSPFAIARR